MQDTRFERKAIWRALLASAACVLTATSCAQINPLRAKDTSQSPSASPADKSKAKTAACPYEVMQANAWINRMPSLSQSVKYHVVLSLIGEPGAACPKLTRLTQTAKPGTGEITLNLEADEQCPLAAGAPFEARYSAPIKDTAPSAIAITCGGDEIIKIDDVMSVY